MRCVNRHKVIVLEQRPEVLKGIGSLPKRVWSQYQVLNLMPPLERAEFYAREMSERRASSYRALAKLLDEPVHRMRRYLQLLELPAPIKTFLKQHTGPAYVRFFTERRLRELLRVGSSRAAWQRFQGMVRKVEREAGIWGSRRR